MWYAVMHGFGQRGPQNVSDLIDNPHSYALSTAVLPPLKKKHLNFL